ncbi:MAG TPA: OmpH family outer membrane protein [Armatimonadota bacterium]|nr:OmpH family outer membrane protein [Armatimonadota bacterium]HOJ22148.1 OmpH family outer membrane protein [Armatimonadota bacterium]HOM81068.1 OmpH family outer membrane protein [Armatimonadota bacterium]HOQ28101.1 OmpH family outer membrane protein [Armatimonadota bacterium]HPO74007.1 OmpH family outer membrane protein [Armatimonadota bacterium]
MFRRFCLLALVALFAGAGRTTAVAQAAAGEQPAAVSIGVVDMERVSEDSLPYKEANKELQALQQSLNQNIQEVAQLTYLTGPETNELVAILDAKELTAAQKARHAELKKTADEREKEFSTLMQTKNPTDQQKKRLQELNAMRNGREQILAELNQKYQQSFRQKLQEVDAQLGKSVSEIINEVAKARKLSIVLSKSVIITLDRKQDVIFFGGTDITDEVIKRLNQRK